MSNASHLRGDNFKTRVKTRVDPDAARAQAEGEALAPRGTPSNPSSQVFTVANVITFFRFALTVAFLCFFVNGEHRVLALICYGVAASTDFLDGQIARRTQTVSWLGKLMDPIMDRILLFTGVLGLMITGELPIWIAVFIIGRDTYLAIGAMVLQKYRRRPVDVVFIGKVTTALLMTGFCDLLLGVPKVPGLGLIDVSWLPGFGSSVAILGVWFVYAGVICSAITAVIYTKEGFFFKRERLAGHDVESSESNERAREAIKQ
ncbi:MAG: CDP-alcohol phosphatidyltransferase family protein [Atopobiaceae bacterium]